MDEKLEYVEGLIDTGKYEKAIDFLNEIIDAERNIKAYQIRGFAYYCMHDYESAIPDLQYVVENDESSDLANYYLSQIYSLKADFIKAKEYIEKATAIDQENIEFLGDYVAIEQSLKNFTHSIELCDRILSDTPDSNFALNARGYANMRLGNVDLAINDFTQAVKESPMDFVGWNNLGIAFLKKGEREIAFKHFQTSLRQNPMNPEAYNYIGFLNYERGDMDKALQYINRAIELDPSNSNTLKNRALVFLSRNETEKAKADLLMAKELGYADFYDGTVDELLSQV
jgi:tetratricopeptide (TPR) repeat protein